MATTKTYSQLTKEIEALKAAADKQLAIEKQGAVERVNKVIAEYNLTPADLSFAAGFVGGKVGKKNKTGADKVDVKYSDANGNTWSGRGPRPAWLRAALAGGSSLESFAGVAGTAASGVAKPTGRKLPSKAAGVALPAKYADPKTGASWSGRGSTPKWLKQALKKRGSKIEDFLIGASTAAPAAKAQPATPAAAPTKASVKSVKARATTKAAAKASVPAAAAPAVPPAAVKTASKAPAKAPAKKAVAPAKKATAKAAPAKVAPKVASAVTKKAAKPAAKKAPTPRAVKSLPAKAEGAAKTAVKIAKVDASPTTLAIVDVPATVVSPEPSHNPSVDQNGSES